MVHCAALIFGINGDFAALVQLLKLVHTTNLKKKKNNTQETN